MRKSSMQPKYYSEMLQIWFPTMPFLIRSHSISKFIATAHSLFSTTGRNCWKHELDSNGVSQVNDVTCKLFWTEAIATAGIAQPQQHSNIPLKLLSALQFFHHFHWIQISPSYASESRRKHNGSTWIGPHTSLWTSSSTVHDPPSWNGLHYILPTTQPSQKDLPDRGDSLTPDTRSCCTVLYNSCYLKQSCAYS